MLQNNNETLDIKIDWPNPIHEWLQNFELSFQMDYRNPVLDEVLSGLRDAFLSAGHQVREVPTNNTRLIFSSAKFGEAINWRAANMFTARRRFKLSNTPTILTLLHAKPAELEMLLRHFDNVIPNHPPSPEDYPFPELAPEAYKTLYEQGNRGGPIMALVRLLQSQAKCIRLLLIVGESRPEYAYLFDLVGAYPKIEANNKDYFYKDIMYRIATSMSTSSITNHKILETKLSFSAWERLETPAQMIDAAREFGKRNFFTEMIHISNLVQVPSIPSAIANQYSEGCFATWDASISGLIATVTGSARPVEKDAISSEDLAIIVGVRGDRSGAVIQEVDGKENDPPSSESVEMMEMDYLLPKIRLPPAWHINQPVPVVRSKLHGHRGVKIFDPDCVEFVSLDEAFYYYPVSCSTDAQARAIVQAFSRSEALKNPSDPRTVVFTILPGHGVVIAEKWVWGKKPFQQIYEFFDKGIFEIDNIIPQGKTIYTKTASGLRKIES